VSDPGPAIQKSEQSADVGVAERRRFLSLRGIVELIIGVGALAWVIVKSDPAKLMEQVRQTRVSYLPIALAASVVVTWLMSVRWGVILRVRGKRVDTRRLFAYYLIGIFFMNFVPGGSVSSDVARLIYADRAYRDKPFVLSTLVYERVIGLLTLLLLGMGAMVLSRSTRPAAPLFYFAEGGLTLLFLSSAMLMSDYISARLAGLCEAVGSRLRLDRVGRAASGTIKAISQLRRHKKTLIATFLLSIVIRVVWSLGCYVVARAMDLPLSLPLVFAFISLVDLIRMLPISVGGLGIREWVMIVLFANIGLNREQALTFCFLAFAPILLNAVAGGILYTSGARFEQKSGGFPDVSVKGAGA
jgi:glycosyltransferase 2 family protein